MAGVPLKFRCFQCNQLLGVSRAKAGTTVACPKCKAELLVPEPAEAVPESEGHVSDSGHVPGVSDSGLPLDFLDLRPEDLRVEPGVAWDPLPPDPPTPSEGYLPLIDERREEVPESAATVLEPLASPPAPATPVPGLSSAMSPGVHPVAEPSAAPFQFEPSRVVERQAPARARDVVLPRSAVAAWSLFVLLAQGLAFVAGLLAGHFIWKVH